MSRITFQAMFHPDRLVPGSGFSSFSHVQPGRKSVASTELVQEYPGSALEVHTHIVSAGRRGPNLR